MGDDLVVSLGFGVLGCVWMGLRARSFARLKLRSSGA